ncbi:MAG: hybrid sensor histidine kinase/response regulator [Bacteroidia bacterium]|nr:hybrid sensor histidine kinase/response regulator [Bacteroidia bacterium]MBP7244117.1 hybrid sensor histidine kinase/response regulator [Bacteroidia bacterium]
MKHKILIVDDRPENLYSLECILAQDDREIFQANSGEEALKIAFQEDLSLILLDVQMPDMDGFEVANILKSTKRTRKTPIVFVTAISKEKKYMLKGLEEGAIDYLFKPLDTDITCAKVNMLLQLYAQQIEIEHKNVELNKLNEEKNYFLGMASHDLRNPLGNIITFANFIEDEAAISLSEEHKNYLKIIINTSRGMMELLDNLLDISRIESGEMMGIKSDFNVKDFIISCVNQTKNSADKKNIQLGFSIGDSVKSIHGNQVQLSQVLINLISNAIKFSHAKTSVEVTADILDGQVVIKVTDQGQGIPESEQSKVFDAFTKTSVRSTAGEGSTGLGLNIAKKLIESHGGKIWLTSKKGKGSTFAFSIPLVQENTPLKA